MKLITQAEYLTRLGRRIPTAPGEPEKFAIVMVPTVACSRCHAPMPNGLDILCDDTGRMFCTDCAPEGEALAVTEARVLELEAALHAILDTFVCQGGGGNPGTPYMRAAEIMGRWRDGMVQLRAGNLSA